jgi:starch phosphorylase
VEHPEASQTAASPAADATAELGTVRTLRVRVRLAALTPDDVEVQAVAGRVDGEDRITGATAFPLKPVAGPDLEGRWTYEGPLTLTRTGPFGYTVRVLPSHPLLPAPADLGLVTLPTAPAHSEEPGVLLR